MRSCVSKSNLGKVFRVRHQDGVEQEDGCLMTFAYWDPGFLGENRLLNAQTGEPEGVDIRREGSDDVKVGSKEVIATRYALTTNNLVEAVSEVAARVPNSMSPCLRARTIRCDELRVMACLMPVIVKMTVS